MLASTVQFSSNGRPADTRHAYPHNQGAVHTSPRPVTIKTPGPPDSHHHETNPRKHPPKEEPIASGPNSVLANQTNPHHQRSPTQPRRARPRRAVVCTSRPARRQPDPSSQCSTHEQPPDTRSVPTMVCLTPTPPTTRPENLAQAAAKLRGGIRCSLERR